jgi:hypothetical protein
MNELKNVTLSFLKINYMKDVFKSNIDKNCNNIYCEAETSSFNLAKNSYELLLSNDIFNTKSYIFMILFILILLFIHILYNFITLNTKYIGELEKSCDKKRIGDNWKECLKYFPYIINLFILIFIIVIIILRYSPNEKKGYEDYFEKYIEIISNYFNIFIVLYIIFYIFICFFMTENIALTKNYVYILIITLIIFSFYIYLIINIMNILLTFRENNNINTYRDKGNKDLSYGNQNVFYEKYYDMIKEHYIFSENAKYDIKGYLIKNIGTLLLFIIAFFILFSFILFIINEFIINKTNLDECLINYVNNGIILKPLFIFILLVLFIFIFILFNTDYNKLVIFGVYNSFYKCKLNELNNLIIPYIKLHELKAINNEDDFTEQYIVTNILSSIINNTLVMTSCGDFEDFGNKNDMILSEIDGKFTLYDNLSFSIFNTTYKKDFAEYYKNVLSSNIDKKLISSNSIYNYINNMHGNKASYTTTPPISDINIQWDNNSTSENKTCVVNEIPNIHLVDNYIDMYKYKYRYRIFSIINICKKIFTKENSENNFEEYKSLFTTYFKFYKDDTKNIPHKFLINIKNNEDYRKFIDSYIEIDEKYDKSFILDNIDELNNKIVEKALLDIELFSTELKKINEEHQEKKEYLNYIVSLYSKYLFSLSKEDRLDNKDNKNIKEIYDTLKEKAIGENSPNNRNIYSIIDDFLTISSHIKYNSYYLSKNPKLHEIINEKNKNLFELIIDTNLNDSIDKTLDNSFEYDMVDTYYRKTSEENRIIKPIFSHISSFVSVNDFNNNYLKQTIYMIYKQINYTYVKFNNKDENTLINIEENILNGESLQKKDSQSENILNNANNVVNAEFITYYIINIMIIFIMFYIGKSRDASSYNIFSIIYGVVYKAPIIKK